VPDPAPVPFDANFPELVDGEVLIWWLELDREHPARTQPVLSGTERERAERFAFDRDRRRFIAGRFFLRTILAHYAANAATAPGPLAIDEGAHGKPLLADASGIEFNLSHTDGIGLLAVTHGRAVGIDIERNTLPAAPHELAKSVFTEHERRSLLAAGEANLSAAFFTCWTRKEAYLKALGTGMSLDPKTVHVGCGQYDIDRTQTDSAKSHGVRIETIVENTHFIASLAVLGGFQGYRVVNRLRTD
jgi:4'-phosphopantetheinyl transferase